MTGMEPGREARGSVPEPEEKGKPDPPVFWVACHGPVSPPSTTQEYQAPQLCWVLTRYLQSKRPLPDQKGRHGIAWAAGIGGDRAQRGDKRSTGQGYGSSLVVDD